MSPLQLTAHHWLTRESCVACAYRTVAPHLKLNVLQPEWSVHYWTTHGWDPEEVAAWIYETLVRRGLTKNGTV